MCQRWKGWTNHRPMSFTRLRLSRHCYISKAGCSQHVPEVTADTMFGRNSMSTTTTRSWILHCVLQDMCDLCIMPQLIGGMAFPFQRQTEVVSRTRLCHTTFKPAQENSLCFHQFGGRTYQTAAWHLIAPNSTALISFSGFGMRV